MSQEQLVSELGAIAKKHGKEMGKEMIVAILIPALEEAVKKSSTPIDDVVLAALKEPLKQAALDLLEKL